MKTENIITCCILTALIGFATAMILSANIANSLSNPKSDSTKNTELIKARCGEYHPQLGIFQVIYRDSLNQRIRYNKKEQ